MTYIIITTIIIIIIITIIVFLKTSSFFIDYLNYMLHKLVTIQQFATVHWSNFFNPGSVETDAWSTWLHQVTESLTDPDYFRLSSFYNICRKRP